MQARGLPAVDDATRARARCKGVRMSTHVSAGAVHIGSLGLEGILCIPDRASGIVVFAHGSGSGRLSPRNNRVACFLQDGGMATLLLDLLTQDEAADRANVFDIALLGRRVGEALRWVRAAPACAGLPVGLFGASTGAAAALVAAAVHPGEVAAIVSRGGRPDLAGERLAAVRAPTLLIVGGEDGVVVDLNRESFERLQCEKSLSIVPGATHLFEEPGALEQVMVLARDWFARHFATLRAGDAEAGWRP